MFNMTGLLWIGIFFFALMVLFSILTLPVEVNASTRGLRMLREAGLLESENDAHGARQVLTAAALTYLAAAITSILQLLYYISVAQRRARA
jgi:Zn-dependent membrane protease YugP